MLKKKQRSSEPTSDRRPIRVAYKLLNFVLPIGLLLLIQLGLVELSILLALFSKWRVFAVKPRHMLANLRSNLVDITVKVSTLAFMIEASDAEATGELVAWTAWYVLWLTLIKPGSTRKWMTFQAGAAHLLGVSAVLLFSNNLNDVFTLGIIWLVALSSARHYISSYEDPKTQLISHMWALFVLQLAWVLNKWLLVYVFVPQLIFIVGVVGYTLASIYDAQKNEKLKAAFVRQQAGMSIAVLILIIILADWQGSA